MIVDCSKHLYKCSVKGKPSQTQYTTSRSAALKASEGNASFFGKDKCTMETIATSMIKDDDVKNYTQEYITIGNTLGEARCKIEMYQKFSNRFMSSFDFVQLMDVIHDLMVRLRECAKREEDPQYLRQLVSNQLIKHKLDSL